MRRRALIDHLRNRCSGDSTHRRAAVIYLFMMSLHASQQQLSTCSLCPYVLVSSSYLPAYYTLTCYSQQQLSTCLLYALICYSEQQLSTRLLHALTCYSEQQLSTCLLCS